MGARRKGILFLVVLLACINNSYGCAVSGTLVAGLYMTTFRDVDRGIIFDTETTGITGTQSISYGRDDPYITLTYENSRVIAVTNDNYKDYEEYETIPFISVNVMFTCAPGSALSTLAVTFRVDIVDTNNNAPQFLPTGDLSYTIATPVPPNYDITGCGNEIVVRDIDLTTREIIFTVDHPDFEIENVLPNTTPKEFKAVLRTKTLIRSIPEDIVLRITATDVDDTNDPPLQTDATVTISGSSEFAMPDELAFSETFYRHTYDTSSNEIVDPQPIILENGFDDKVRIYLHGELSNHFDLDTDGNRATLKVVTALPVNVLSNQYIFFEVRAEREDTIGTAATIVVQLPEGSQAGESLWFEKVLYRGSIEGNQVSHEDIIVPGFDGTTVILTGDHSSLFAASATDGVVTVRAQGSLNLPAEVTRLEFELRAATARAVLLLNLGGTDPDVPVQPPTVTFTSNSYAVTVEIVQTGIVGRVLATADNGEAVTYTLADVNAHLQSRLSINNEGELFLSAPANSGVYTFRVIATTVITEAAGTATVHLTVLAVTTCGDDTVMPPLITLDRDEEEPHNNLVVLQPSLHAGCHFTVNTLHPAGQDWLYVDENGLHARIIDREHPSIAFMVVSQVQAELILHCEIDKNIRTKRSQRTDLISESDTSGKNWILTDSIPYNSRRSLVNLIVNDINDNNPIFVGKEQEPIAVGYPIEELEDRILPRSLAELNAKDADIGWNAALRYWSAESTLAVAPTTGFVHVQSSASLQNNQLLTVHATDRNGEGNTGSIQLVVKLLTANHIAVVTVRNAFLDQEARILEQLSETVGYSIKALRSEVISEDGNPSRQDSGVSLQIYIYGLINREPVGVEVLTENINNNTEIVNVISTVPLEDHLDDIVFQRNVGLLVTTIILSVLLFILIVLIGVWYFLRWRKNRNYDEFSDKNSVASRNESLGDLSKPAEVPPVPVQPRLNIDELKRSERRLQEMLDAPIEEVTVEPVPVKKEPSAPPLEAILDIPTPEINVPIVIQSIDKLKDAEESDDEFGEIVKTPRKSVVTFNENVEKIIHVEDDTENDNSSQSGYEIYKF